VRQSPPQRVVVLAEGAWGGPDAKTGIGFVRYGHDSAVAILDSSQAGGNARELLGPRFDIPIVASLEETDRFRPTVLLIGVANAGGYLPDGWMPAIRGALRRGMEVWNGLHLFFGAIPELVELEHRHGGRIVDLRRPPAELHVASGRRHLPGRHVVLTVGTDCAIGKMTVALELRHAAREAGLRAAFVPTGQTGMVIDGWGVTVDRVPSDFVAGVMEDLVAQAEETADWIFVEGQGSLDHPAYSGVTLSILHGSQPHGLILCDEPTRTERKGWEGYPIDHDLARVARLHEQVAGLVAPARTVGIALDTRELDDPGARRAIAEAEWRTGLVADDVLRHGPARLFAALRERLAAPGTAAGAAVGGDRRERGDA